MKLFNGNEMIKFETDNEKIILTLEKSQVKLSEILVIQNYVDVVPGANDVQIQYELTRNLLSFSKVSLQAKTSLEKLRLACQLRSVQMLKGNYKIPFIHPENIYISGESLKLIHFGLSGIMSPKELDDDLFLKEVKALVLSIFHSKLNYESLLEGMDGLKDSFSLKIVSAKNTEEVFDTLDEEFLKEKSRIDQSKRLVSKNSFVLYRSMGVVAILASIIMGFFLYQYKEMSDKESTIVKAQTSFITNNYAEVQTDLEKYQTDSLPKSANYILAVSSVNLSDLTATQKESILSNLSIKTDDNTLHYWVNMGRGNFEDALSLAQNLGDDQLTLLAYTDLYEATKLNTSMAGDKKQKLLEEYTKRIDELSKKLGK